MVEAATNAGPRTTEMAHSRMDMHEAVCAERYKSIHAGLSRIEAAVLALQTDTHGRLNTISNRMWTWITGVLGGVVVGLGVVSFFLLTKGLK